MLKQCLGLKLKSDLIFYQINFATAKLSSKDYTRMC